MPKLLIAALLLFPSLVFADRENGEMEITQIADGVYQHISYLDLPNTGFFPSNGLVVVEGKDAYIVDTPWPEGDTEKLVKWIEDQGFHLKASISTHFHDDRASGIGYLNRQSVDTYASALTNELLKKDRKVQASHSFEGDHFTLLEGRIEAFYPGPGHTQDNIVVWLPKEQILVGGCLVKSLSSKNMGYTGDASIADWPTSVQKLLKRFPEAKTVIPGHGESGSTSLLYHTYILATQAGSEIQP